MFMNDLSKRLNVTILVEFAIMRAEMVAQCWSVIVKYLLINITFCQLWVLFSLNSKIRTETFLRNLPIREYKIMCETTFLAIPHLNLFYTIFITVELSVVSFFMQYGNTCNLNFMCNFNFSLVYTVIFHFMQIPLSFMQIISVNFLEIAYFNVATEKY